jgi:hypothetical protein
MSDNTTVVVVVRDPDASNDYRTFGPPVTPSTSTAATQT